MSTTKLNQIIAIKKGVVTSTQSALTALYQQIQKRDPLLGISKTYRSKDEDGDMLPPESKNVQVKVADILSETAKIMSRLFDVTATNDWTNCNAKADIVIDGNILMKDVPATYLIFLEKQLINLHTVVSKLPTLDPAENWHFDANIGLYATDPTETVRNKKIPRSRVLYEATDKHPAQVESYFEDVLVGYWKTIRFSGEIPATEREKLMTKITRLQEAVKFARERANETTITDVYVGKVVFEYLLA